MACWGGRLGRNSDPSGREGLTEGDVRAMRESGFEVNVWTVNDVEQARELARGASPGFSRIVPRISPPGVGALEAVGAATR